MLVKVHPLNVEMKVTQDNHAEIIKIIKKLEKIKSISSLEATLLYLQLMGEGCE